MNNDELLEYRKIGARIREVRLQKGMSQNDLAVKAQIALPSVSNIELGKAQMKLSTFIRIAEALQVSTDELLRPDVPAVNRIYQTEFQELLGDCSPAEIDSVINVVKEVINTLHRRKNDIAD